MLLGAGESVTGRGVRQMCLVRRVQVLDLQRVVILIYIVRLAGDTVGGLFKDAASKLRKRLCRGQIADC